MVGLPKHVAAGGIIETIQNCCEDGISILLIYTRNKMQNPKIKMTLQVMLQEFTFGTAEVVMRCAVNAKQTIHFRT
jgi:hypothetical protein